MLSNPTSTTARGSLLVLVAGIVVGSTAATAQTTLLEHPTLKKYPSSQEIAEQVQQLRLSDPGAVEQIIADFDLAIRSSLVLVNPGVASQPRPVSGRRIGVGILYHREMLLHLIEERRSELDRTAEAAFYQEHLEELALDDHPESGLIMLDILARGWEDWSAWDPANEKLSEVRMAYPEVHRLHAMGQLRRLRYKPALGVLLRIVRDERSTARLRGGARLALQEIGNHEDVLSFYIAWGREAPNATVGDVSLWSEIQVVSNRLIGISEGQQRARSFWEPYIESDVPTLWYCAQKAWDRHIPEDLNWLSKAQGDWNYEHEPNPAVRDLLGRKRDLARRIAEISAKEDPQTNRLMPEDAAALQELHIKREALEAEYKQLTEGIEKLTKQQPSPDARE